MKQITITKYNEYDYRDDAALIQQGAKKNSNCSLNDYVHNWTPGCEYKLILADGRTVTPAILERTGDEKPFDDEVKEECYREYLESNIRNGHGHISRSQYDEMISLAASTLGRKGGSSTSPAKRKASAENGKKGGRPEKRYDIVTLLADDGASEIVSFRDFKKTEPMTRRQWRATVESKYGKKNKIDIEYK